MFGCSEAGCESKHKSPGSSHRMSGSAMTYAAPAPRLRGRLGAYDGGRHPYIQQHKVIVWKSIVAQQSAYWQSPQLDSNSTEARALHPFSFSVHTARKSCLIQEPLYFFFFFFVGFHEHSKTMDRAANLTATAKSETMTHNTNRLNSTTYKRA